MPKGKPDYKALPLILDAVALIHPNQWRVIHLLPTKVTLGIVVADVFDHLIDIRNFGSRQQAALYLVPDDITQDTSEIFMARIRQEAAGVGQHTDETA